MFFGVLGPLLVRDADAVVEVSAPRQRVLLAALTVHAGTAVPAGALAEMVRDSPSAVTTATLRSYIMRLRRALGATAGARISTRYPGYLLNAGTDEVDVLRFAALYREGGAALRAGDMTGASLTLGQALGLWRGAALADISCDSLRGDQVPGLERQRLQAIEWRNEARLRLGGHDELITELQSLTSDHPLQERFHAQLMLALYRCGREAEALAVYQRARDVLSEELGTKPGAELSDLHQRILTGDAGLARSAPPRPAAPRQLPVSVPHFTGRPAELAVLDGLLGDAHPTAVISAIGGTAGVGKTALAVHWAHRVADRFPDGQLYVNLRGYDPGEPMAAAEALGGFLRAFGLPGRDIPVAVEERAAAYRSLLAGRRVLVVLDNARSVEQVRPLLPGSPTCFAVVTSRDSLAGLVAREGAARLDLDLLPMAEAVSLLRTLVGRRAAEDPRATANMAGQCSRLPLALRVAAELAIANPTSPLAELTGELAGLQQRLDLLAAGGDPRTAVRAVFSWSYRNLDTDAAHAFRRLALHPALDFDCRAAAALTGGTVKGASEQLDRLARASLIQPTAPGRYIMHDLLRAYALELEPDAQQERHAALSTLFDYYLHTAATAMDTLYPAEHDRRPATIEPSGCAPPAPPMADPAAARSWLHAERATLVTVAAYTAAHGWPSHAARLAATLSRYLDAGSHHPEAVRIYTHAHRAARQVGDHAAEAAALVGLGVVNARQGNYPRATEHLTQALALTLASGDRHSQARALSSLSLVEYRQGRYERAAGCLARALTLARETGNRVSEAYALASLGNVERRRGLYQQATDHLTDALTAFREAGEQAGEGHALNGLGDVRALRGEHRQAIGHLRQALALARQAGDRIIEAEVRNSLGDAVFRGGDKIQAGEQYAAALGLASQTGDRYQRARAYEGLARSGRTAAGREHLRRAFRLYAGLGTPEARRIRVRLAR